MISELTLPLQTDKRGNVAKLFISGASTQLLPRAEECIKVTFGTEGVLPANKWVLVVSSAFNTCIFRTLAQLMLPSRSFDSEKEGSPAARCSCFREPAGNVRDQ